MTKPHVSICKISGTPVGMKARRRGCHVHAQQNAQHGGEVQTDRLPPTSSHVGAFSLIELLVVIGIMILLAGVMVPHFATARKTAMVANCISNQKQISIAMQKYAMDYMMSYPIAHYYKGRTEYAWDTITKDGEARPGIIWQYTRTGDYRVQQCPSFKGNSNTTADLWTGYNYNTTYIGRGWGERNWKGMTQAPATLGQLKDPARTALLGDGGYSAGANKFMRAPNDKAGEYITHAGSQAFRHRNNTTVVMWADGHGSEVQTPKQKKKLRGGSRMLDLMGYPENGFLSEDDELYDRE